MGILGPEGPETPVNGRSGLNLQPRFPTVTVKQIADIDLDLQGTDVTMPVAMNYANLLLAVETPLISFAMQKDCSHCSCKCHGALSEAQNS